MDATKQPRRTRAALGAPPETGVWAGPKRRELTRLRNPEEACGVPMPYHGHTQNEERHTTPHVQPCWECATILSLCLTRGKHHRCLVCPDRGNARQANVGTLHEIVSSLAEPQEQHVFESCPTFTVWHKKFFSCQRGPGVSCPLRRPRGCNGLQGCQTQVCTNERLNPLGRRQHT